MDGNIYTQLWNLSVCSVKALTIGFSWLSYQVAMIHDFIFKKIQITANISLKIIFLEKPQPENISPQLQTAWNKQEMSLFTFHKLPLFSHLDLLFWDEIIGSPPVFIFQRICRVWTALLGCAHLKEAPTSVQRAEVRSWCSEGHSVFLASSQDRCVTITDSVCGSKTHRRL